MSLGLAAGRMAAAGVSEVVDDSLAELWRLNGGGKLCDSIVTGGAVRVVEPGRDTDDGRHDVVRYKAGSHGLVTFTDEDEGRLDVCFQDGSDLEDVPVRLCAPVSSAAAAAAEGSSAQQRRVAAAKAAAQGKPEVAAAELVDAVASDPTLAAAWVDLAKVLLKLERPKAALAAAKKAGDGAQALLARARAHAAAGSVDKADATLSEAERAAGCPAAALEAARKEVADARRAREESDARLYLGAAQAAQQALDAAKSRR